MQPFRTILFAGDFSEISREAFRMAAALTVENRTRLLVVHVLGPDQLGAKPAVPDQAADSPSAMAGEFRHESLRQALCETYTPNHPVDVSCIVREGEIAAEILATAREIRADLIVMGTHGRTGLSRLLAGSVATAVLREATCPVLALSDRAGKRTNEPVQAILHPTDFSPCSEGALRVARRLAGDIGARVILLHVLPLAILMDGSMSAEVDPKPSEESLDLLRKSLDGPDMKYPIEVRLARGYDREEILRAAEAAGCDLIVMGSHGRTGLGRLLFGSVAEAVISRADRPVMVVKVPQPIPPAQPSAPKTVTVF